MQTYKHKKCKSNKDKSHKTYTKNNKLTSAKKLKYLTVVTLNYSKGQISVECKKRPK